MDKLIVKDMGRLDGEYSFDVVAMLNLGAPDALTSREGHRIKTMCGLRVGELQEALEAGDSDVLVAFAAVILARHGKKFDDDDLWDAPIGSAMLEIGERPEEVDDRPPVSSLPSEEQSSEPSQSGGESSSPTSEPEQESDPSPTGLHALPRSATSDQETLAS